ncbi:MAG: Oligopeptide transport ATP-binding protein OppF [Chloroflexi bacterium ADurb.Bin325]|nr:MAG: Oligopeptide transport ATP-binding protein OppF [Chloroflexi bacterium ADurb.Bin325]
MIDDRTTPTNHAILEVSNLKKHYPIVRGWRRRLVGYTKAVDDISFAVPAGKTVGLVGESGCGKTTTGHCIMRGIDPTAGKILFNDKQLGQVDLASATPEALRQVRLHIQMVFQDPSSSLNPRMTLLQTVSEPLIVNGVARGKDAEERVAQLLRLVGLLPEHMHRFPHAFSGGQRQRIGVARALALRPQLIIADEPVSALDVSIQAQTLNLLQELQEQFNLSYLFISHDLSVVEHISDRVAVMYVGKLVEMADTEELFHNPKHPYTEALLSSVPNPDPLAPKKRIVLMGEVPSPSNPPSGCYFHPRCRYAQEICARETPPLVQVAPGHQAACHFADRLSLTGITAVKI